MTPKRNSDDRRRGAAGRVRRESGAKPAGPGVPPPPSSEPRLILQPGREKSLQRRHPWVFSGAVARVDGSPAQGETVEVLSSDGAFLGWAAYNGQSRIVGRVWSFDRAVPLSADGIANLVRRSIARRERSLAPGAPEAVRLVHGEADGLPGVVVDRFADQLVIQLGSAGAWHWRDAIIDAAVGATGVERVFERSDMDVLALEGLPIRVGAVRGDAPEAPIRIEEGGLAFEVDVREGHKTGFYLDQRDNRALLRDLVRDREVLDCFCYTGGFTVNALAGGAAYVTAVDSSAEALAAARRHVRLNGLPEARVDFVDADVFALLRRLRDQARKFDVIVLDPPKFAPTAASAERAARGYKDINLWAMRLLRPGGLLMTYSCSGGVSRDLFQKIVAGAAVDAGVDARILHHMSAASDHPVALSFPEGEYLKGLLCEVGG